MWAAALGADPLCLHSFPSSIGKEDWTFWLLGDWGGEGVGREFWIIS